MLVNTFEKNTDSASEAISWIMSRVDYKKLMRACQYASENPTKETKVVLFEYLYPNAAHIRKYGNSAAVHFLSNGVPVNSMIRSNHEVHDFMDKMFRTANTDWYVRFNHYNGEPESSSCQVVLRFLERLPPLVPWPHYSPISHNNSSQC